MPNINCGGGHSFFMTLLENQQMIFKKNENALLRSKKENEGKLKKVAKIAGLNKFLRMYYGIVKKKYRELNIW